MPGSHFVTHAEIQTAYHDLGTGAPFVLVHGFTGSKLDFASQLGWFSGSHRVIAYDQRGHGESSHRAPYSLARLADDLISFLDAMDLPSCHILGHSMGGMVVLRAILTHPERFRSLILMDTAPHGVHLFSDAIRKRLVDMVRQDGCQVLFNGMRTREQPPSVQRGIDFLGAHEHWRRIRTKLEQMDPLAFAELGRELGNQNDLTSELSTLHLPTTVIVGQSDEPFVKPSQTLAAQIPEAQLQVIDKAAHSPQYENPVAWRAVIEQHLAWTGAGP